MLIKMFVSGRKKCADASRPFCLFFQSTCVSLYIMSLESGVRTKISRALHPGSNICIAIYFYIFVEIRQNFLSSEGNTPVFWSARNRFESLFIPNFYNYNCDFESFFLILQSNFQKLFPIHKTFRNENIRFSSYFVTFGQLVISRRLRVAILLASCIIHIWGFQFFFNFISSPKVWYTIGYFLSQNKCFFFRFAFRFFDKLDSDLL